MKNFLLLLVAIPLFAACKKDDSTDPVITPHTERIDIPLTLGSYWIYKTYLIRHLTGDTAHHSQLDSMYVSGTTSNGLHTYTILMDPMWGGQPTPRHVRDSLGYLVDSEGQIHYSSHDFTNILKVSYPVYSDSSLFVTYKMAGRDSVITVAAGTFATKNFRGKISESSFAPLTNNKHENYLYAPNIGLVLKSAYYAYSGDALVKELVRYHIAP